jgi:hypothetical protein
MPEFSDEIWKRAIHNLFQPMVLFYFPRLSEEVDWSQGHTFLEQELANLYTPEKMGKRFVDVLAQMHLFSGEDTYVLFHVEVQGYGSGEEQIQEFEERMFDYYYRIRDKWGHKNIVSLAILTDNNANYRPDRYEISFHGTTLTYAFNVCKIIDFEEDLLEKDPNPFATVMLAAKRAFRVERRDDETKSIFKIALIHLGLQRGRTPEEIEGLLRFVDWIITISDLRIKKEYVQKVRTLVAKEGKTMPYITSFEEITKMETEEEVKMRTARKMLRMGEPEEKILLYAEITREQLEELRRQQSASPSPE